MEKTSRNDKCQCGSGKKFKKCCIDKFKNGSNNSNSSKKEERSEFLKYVKDYDSGHVLNLITALQLIPGNHGKNIRFELLAARAVKNLSSGAPGDYNKLNSIINNEFPLHYFEDPPEELFTENVLFYGGNYTVMAGINTKCVDIFKYLFDAIYLNTNNLSKEFKDEIFNGVSLLLNIGATLFEKNQLKRNLFVENVDKHLILPENLQRLSFNSDELKTICISNNIPTSIIEYFITEPSEPKLEDHYISPLLIKPFVKFNDEYYFVLPSCQVSAINEYILLRAKQRKFRQEIHRIFHDKIWQDTLSACFEMDWLLTDISLPKQMHSQSIIEGIFQFDAYTLAYICYTFPSELKVAHETYHSQNPEVKVERRISTVITDLKGRKEFEGFHFLTIILINPMGGFLTMRIEKSQENEHRIWFNVFDFISLAHAGEWRRMDLWKFSKVYQFTSNEEHLLSTTPLDAYATYKRNGETFYFSDEARGKVILVAPGEGADLIRESKQTSDVHGVLSLIDGSLVYQNVKRYRSYAPIYKPVKQRISYEVLLETFSIPLWIQNYQAKNKTEAYYVEQLVDAICFWLDKLKPVLNQQINENIVEVLNIVLEFEDSDFSPLSLEQVDSKEVFSLKLQCSYSEGILTLGLPKNIYKLFIGGDNSGERELMTNILKSLNFITGFNLSNEYILESINNYMPVGQSKMILLFDTRKDPQIDDRWLFPSLYISDAEINLLLDRLVDIINPPDPIPNKFQGTQEKKEFCNYVVFRLVQHLIEKLKIFNDLSLITRLIEINERHIHDREFSKIKTAAEIHCFGNNDEELDKILKKQRKLVNTSLATRCLIEFATLVPNKGDRNPSFDQLDELLAIMNEILNFGMLSDAIHFGMDDPEIGLLASGRIGISKDFYDQKLQRFYVDNTVANIEAQLETFSENFETYIPQNDDLDTKTFFDKVDDAFLHDWGIDYTNLIAICIHASKIAEQQNDSIMSMLESELLIELKNMMKGAEDQVESGLNKLRFEYKSGVITNQKGYLFADYFPWKYNREFSYARRPFIVVNTDEGRKYYWGMRHCIAASMYLQYLFHSGSLTHGGAKINSLLGVVKNSNGKKFRNTVTTWLKNNTDLIVWDYEVTIKQMGHLNADKDYGDSDIFAYDPVNNQVYNIECKRTVAAKNIHQMKNEMDDYLGRAGQKKKIAKHVERDNWLQGNLNKVQKLVSATELPKVKSIILTSELIPTRYLKSEVIPLPIISYRELKRSGYELLLRC